MEILLKKLEYAKQATKKCLENGECLIDFHGLEFWAKQVEELRKEIKKSL